MDNIYTPPKFKTVTPPIEHHRTTPDYTRVPDEIMKQFFTNVNEPLLKAVRRIKNQ